MTDKPIDPMTLPSAWNAVAVAYDEAFTVKTPELADKAIELLDPKPDAVVLDVAAGPGPTTIRLASRVAKIVAIDFADAMVERLRANLAKRSITNVETHVMDGLALQLRDATFDAAMSMFGWFLFPDRMQGLAEMRRVLRPGGRVLVTSWLPPEKNTVLGAARDAIFAALPDPPKPPGILPTQQPDVVAGELRDAGFRDVAVHEHVVRVTYDSADEYVDQFVRAGAPIQLLKRRLGDDAFAKVPEKAKATLRERLGNGPVSFELAAIYATAVR
jgi:SAM-dependent methyltransferase